MAPLETDHLEIKFHSDTDYRLVKEHEADIKRGRRQFSYRSDGEPIPPHTYRTFAAQLLDQWMKSPGHRANILADQPTLLGAACVPSKSKLGMDQFHCVQVFARR